MPHKTLALVLAGGEGSRVRHHLQEDEQTKPMIRTSKDGDTRLIDLILDSIECLDAEKAVLSYPSEEFAELDRRVAKRTRVLKQWAANRKFIRSLPHLLELPYILLTQYHWSEDRDYLQSFDSILTAPCDIVLNGVDLGDFLRFHYEHLESPVQKQVTILSRLDRYSGRAALFKMDGSRIVGLRRYRGFPLVGYEVSTQAGIYLVSKGSLKTPEVVLPLRHNKFLRYLTHGDWIDYGNPETLQRLRE